MILNKNIDIYILFCSILLCIFGIFNIFGANSNTVYSQIIFCFLGLLAYFIVLWIGDSLFKANAFLLYCLFFLSLIYVIFFASPIKGAQRWISFGIFNFQPSELFKPFFLLFFAMLLSLKTNTNNSLFSVFFESIFFIVPIILIALQPDLGNAVIYGFVSMSVLFIARKPISFFILTAVLIILSSPFLWLLLREYQKIRLISFLQPSIDTLGISYNIQQAFIAIGSGGLFGKGLAFGTQSRLRFLPEYSTDFAFASLVEQFGFIGGLIVIVLYAFIISRIILKAKNNYDNLFSFLFFGGASFFIFASVMINIGMNLGLFPVTGVALPFISYGGSSILSTFLLLALVEILV